MRSLEANRMFFLTVMLDLLAEVGIVVYYSMTRAAYDLVSMEIVTELIFLIPLFLFLFIGNRKSGMSVFKQLGIRKIRLLPAALSVVYLMLLVPVSTLANTVSMLFTENEIEKLEGEITALPLWMSVLMIGVIGPVVEETVFRGAVFNAYRRDKPFGPAPILLSSLLFGLIHLNLNQAIYAVIMGIGFALICEATGSLISSVLCHVSFNSFEVILMYVLKDSKETLPTGEARLDEIREAIAVMLVLSLVCTALAFCLLRYIAVICGRELSLRCIFSRDPRPYPGMQDIPGMQLVQDAPVMQRAQEAQRTPIMPGMPGAQGIPGMPETPGKPVNGGYLSPQPRYRVNRGYYADTLVTPSLVAGIGICIAIIIFSGLI